MTATERVLKACSILGLFCDPSYMVRLGDGRILASAVRIHNLGGRRGMLIFNHPSEVYSEGDELVSQGYGYSILDDPLQGEPFDLQDYVEMFSDWGWSGEPEAIPLWVENEI